MINPGDKVKLTTCNLCPVRCLSPAVYFTAVENGGEYVANPEKMNKIRLYSEDYDVYVRPCPVRIRKVYD